MPKFSPMNFPREGNESFRRSGERTDWASRDGAYKTLQDAKLFPDSGVVPCGQEIRIVQPPILRNGTEVGAGRSIVCEVTFRSSRGWMQISRIEKPENLNARNLTGAKAQIVIAEQAVRMGRYEGLDFKIDSIAPVGSSRPDIIMSSGPMGVQIEAKSVATRAAEITMFDKTISRDRVPSLFDDIADEFIHVENLTAQPGEGSFVRVIDSSPGCSLAGDEGAGKSGSLPSIFSTTNPEICNFGRSIVISHLHENGDNYLGVYNRSSETADIYHTGLGENELGLAEIPSLKSFSLNTYSSGTADRTRIGIRIRI